MALPYEVFPLMAPTGDPVASLAKIILEARPEAAEPDPLAALIPPEPEAPEREPLRGGGLAAAILSALGDAGQAYASTISRTPRQHYLGRFLGERERRFQDETGEFRRRRERRENIEQMVGLERYRRGERAAERERADKKEAAKLERDEAKRLEELRLSLATTYGIELPETASMDDMVRAAAEARRKEMSAVTDEPLTPLQIKTGQAVVGLADQDFQPGRTDLTGQPIPTIPEQMMTAEDPMAVYEAALDELVRDLENQIGNNALTDKQAREIIIPHWRRRAGATLRAVMDQRMADLGIGILPSVLDGLEAGDQASFARARQLMQQFKSSTQAIEEQERKIAQGSLGRALQEPPLPKTPAPHPLATKF